MTRIPLEIVFKIIQFVPAPYLNFWMKSDRTLKLLIKKAFFFNKFRDYKICCSKKFLWNNNNSSFQRCSFCRNNIKYDGKFLKIPEIIIYKHISSANVGFISKNHSLSADFIMDKSDLIKREKCQPDIIFKNYKVLSDYQIYTLRDDYNWNWVFKLISQCYYSDMKLDFIKRFKHELGWEVLSEKKAFDPKTLILFKEFINWNVLSINFSKIYNYKRRFIFDTILNDDFILEHLNFSVIFLQYLVVENDIQFIKDLFSKLLMYYKKNDVNIINVYNSQKSEIKTLAKGNLFLGSDVIDRYELRDNLNLLKNSDHLLHYILQDSVHELIKYLL